MELAEQEIIKYNLEVAFAEDRVANVQEYLNSLTPPESGSFGEMKVFYGQKSATQTELANAQKKLQEQKNLLALAHQKFKEANIEYEKANYLERIEIDKVILEKRKAEEKELDEISTILYNNKKEGA